MTVLSFARRTILVTALAATPAAFASQSSTGLSPNWRDLEIWTRQIQAARETEHALGLQLAGSTGTVLISFAGRVSAAGSGQPPRALDVIVAPALLSNPNTIRRVSLRLVANEGSPEELAIDLGSSLRSDDPSPGAVVRSAATTIIAPDFLRLADAKSLKGSSFGSDFAFRPDQLKAMQDLAVRLRLRAR